MLTHCSGPRGQRWLIQIGTWVALLLLVALLSGGEKPPVESGTAMATATYVGGQTCGTCHPREADLTPLPIGAKADGSERAWMGRHWSKTGRKTLEEAMTDRQPTFTSTERPNLKHDRVDLTTC